jgi:hypothetical protein
MVNSTRGYAALPTRVTRNNREVYHFPRTERAPALPLGAIAENSQERVEATESHSPQMGPGVAGNQIEGHVVTFVVQEAVNPMELVPRESLVSNENHGCVQSAPTGLQPLAIAAPTAPQVELPTTQNAANGLDPHVAGDKLEGYVPRYFLKEDGKHDDS